jgi:hypothetical protein
MALAAVVELILGDLESGSPRRMNACACWLQLEADTRRGVQLNLPNEAIGAPALSSPHDGDRRVAGSARL